MSRSVAAEAANRIPRIAHRAFTLIELLVVIAIIAILAAILFPVFAQARDKARQASCLSNQKQWSTAILSYTQDYDETYPFAMGWYPGDGWLYQYLHDFPGDWEKAVTDPVEQAAYNMTWANSVQPYLKNIQVASCPSASEYEQAGVDYSAANQRKAPGLCSYTYNGLLHSYPLAMVDKPSDTILMSESRGKILYKGFASSNPILTDCGTNPSCMYSPRTSAGAGAAPGAASGMFVARGTMWVHGKGQNFAYTDGHVKWRSLGGTLAPALTSAKVDPWTLYGADGTPTSYYTDASFPCLFRPKYDPAVDQAASRCDYRP